MAARRSLKTLSVLASAALIATSLLGGTADAKKKKKKPKPPAPAACAAYAPGEAGTGAPTTVVTDAATAEAPIVVELATDMGLGDDLGLGVVDQTTSVYQNIQVDSNNPSAGLYVKIEFADRHDYDLYLLNAEGATAANSGVFNPIPEGAEQGIGGGAPEGGWEAGSNYESVTGINTPDCGGYTAQIKSYLTPGGDVTMSIWLGEALVEPAA
ncbi:MAG TPA: hypothetical protein VHJ76_08690 [Actinomycetota bacterium]|nr:hypothetical protein [Actinomycetota bacterium]